jgi:hypothetical protein
MSVFRSAPPSEVPSVAMQPTPLEDKSYDRERTKRKRAAVLCQVGRSKFHTQSLAGIEQEPLVYWWPHSLVEEYILAEKLGAQSPAREGLGTRDDMRFLRLAWELDISSISRDWQDRFLRRWVPLVKGAAGRTWFEPLLHVVEWRKNALILRTWIDEYRKTSPGQYIKNEEFYGHVGVAFTTIGNAFSARAHRYPGVFGEKGSSIFPEDIAGLLCSLNNSRSRIILESLNPSIMFKVGDLNRLPVIRIANAQTIAECVRSSFECREKLRESAIEFTGPGPNDWQIGRAHV